MLILTHQDQLDRTYEEDNRATSRNTSCDDTQRSRRAQGKPASRPTGSTGSSLAASKETRATLVATGPRTITTTSDVAPADSLRLKGSKSSDTQGESNAEENQNQNQNQGGMRKPRRPLRKQGRPEAGERTSQRCTGVDGEGPRMNSVTPVQSPSVSTTTTSPTITAWEAGWNVTNAIQVHTHTQETHCMFVCELVFHPSPSPSKDANLDVLPQQLLRHIHTVSSGPEPLALFSHPRRFICSRCVLTL